MPKGVTVIAAEPLPLDSIADAVRRSGWSARVDGRSLSASGPWGYFGLLPEHTKAEEFEEILPIVQMTVATPVFALMEYWGSDPLPVALSFLDGFSDLLIADDHDVVLPVRRYASKLEAAKVQRAE